MDDRKNIRIHVPRQTYAYIALVVAISTFLELLRHSLKQQQRRNRELKLVQAFTLGDRQDVGRRGLGVRARNMKKYMAACRVLMSTTSLLPRRTINCPWYIKPKTNEWSYLYIDWTPEDDPERFRQFFRMSLDMFHQICDIVREDMVTTPPAALHVLPNRCMIGERQVALAIQRLATGDELLGIGKLFGVSKSTASKCTWKFIQSFNRRARHFLTWPIGDQIDEVKAGFSNRWGFSNCCGAIDVTHFLIELPAGETATAYYDWKHNLSVTMQAVVDSKCTFLDVFIGNPGSIQDSRVLRTSALFRNVVYDRSKLNGQPYITRDGYRVPEYFLADAGYPLYNWLIVPFAKGFSVPMDDWP